MMLVSLVLVWRDMALLLLPAGVSGEACVADVPVAGVTGDAGVAQICKITPHIPGGRNGRDGMRSSPLGLQGLQQTGCHLELSQDSTGTEPRTESPMLRKKPGFPMFKNTTPNRTLAFRVFWFRV